MKFLRRRYLIGPKFYSVVRCIKSIKCTQFRVTSTFGEFLAIFLALDQFAMDQFLRSPKSNQYPPHDGIEILLLI